jgi:FtsP/CotA-like multicopper oxidase with cupredoxin domain
MALVSAAGVVKAALPLHARAAAAWIPNADREPDIGETPFAEPPTVRAEDGLLRTRLRVDWLEVSGARYRTYNGGFVGPTLRFAPGDRVQVLLDNALPAPHGAHGGGHEGGNDPHGFDITNLHTHGLWVSPAGNSDNVLIAIGPGDRFQHEYLIPAEHVAGSFWYHPHRHGSVEEQVKTGMAGAIVIEGGIDALPEVAAAIDRVMVLQQLQPSATVEEAAARNTPDEISGPPDKVTTINALRRPTIGARPGALERWRLIAANYNDILHIEVLPVGGGDPLPLHIIAHDGIPVGAVRQSGRVRLAPGNRVDVMLRVPASGDYVIRKIGDGSQFDVLPADEEIGYLRVEGAAVTPQTPIPTGFPVSFSHPDIEESEVTNRRKVLFSVIDEPGGGVAFAINNRQFEPGRVDQSIELGAVEEWVLENDSDDYHPFHIHVNPFQVVETSDQMIPPGTWMDTVLIPPQRFGVPGRVVMRTRIRRFIGQFVLHCHILGHEDRGMMQLVEIRPRDT